MFRPRCLLSHPALTHHNMSFKLSPVIRLGCFTCGGKHTVSHEDYMRFYCETCGVDFHNGCHKRPRRIIHPYHLQHPLTLFYRDPETGAVSNIIPDASPSDQDIYHQESDTSDDQGQYQFVDIVPSRSDIIFDRCTWCGKDLQGEYFYRCLICSFCLDLPCAERLPPLTLANPKGHHHSLLFLPRPLLVPCDVCGLVDASEPSYACFQCSYMAHQTCIDLPRVIKITRHPHRLHYIPYRSPMSSLCRICYKDVDVKYGQYSCYQEDCTYVVHSKCATHTNVWDGTDLEWEPEETDEEDIASFKKLGEGIIDHFSHEQHPLKLKKHDGVGDTEKQCEACIFPLLSPQFYHCEECNYSLHEVCAGLPRKLDHALHNHTLILNPPFTEGRKTCYACDRASTGFMYACFKKGCKGFVADVRCISMRECFIHKSHEHHIFISTSHSSKDEILCKRCSKRCTESHHLHCTLCEFALCFACGTIPDEIHYRFDKHHPLTLSYGESADDNNIYWCEVCEKRLDQRDWFYTCNECCITVHLECVFDSSYSMKPGSLFQPLGGNVKLIRNSSSTRLFCHECNHRCPGSIFYEGYLWNRKWCYLTCRSEAIVFCSLECTERGMRRPFFGKYR